MRRRRSNPEDRPEDCLQAAIVSFHAAAVRQADCILFSVPNGEWRDPKTAARLSGMSSVVRDLLPEEMCLRPAGLGVLPGVVDLVLLLAGARTVLVEVKIPKMMRPPGTLELFPDDPKSKVLHKAGVLSKAQKRFRNGAVALGHQHFVVRTVEEYADLLEALGVPLRTRPWGPGVILPRPPVGFTSGG